MSRIRTTTLEEPLGVRLGNAGDRNLSSLRHCLCGIVQKIGEDLFELLGIRHDMGQAGGVVL